MSYSFKPHCFSCCTPFSPHLSRTAGCSHSQPWCFVLVGAADVVSRTPRFPQLAEPCPEQHLATIQGQGVEWDAPCPGRQTLKSPQNKVYTHLFNRTGLFEWQLVSHQDTPEGPRLVHRGSSPRQPCLSTEDRLFLWWHSLEST